MKKILSKSYIGEKDNLSSVYFRNHIKKENEIKKESNVSLFWSKSLFINCETTVD